MSSPDISPEDAAVVSGTVTDGPLALGPMAPRFETASARVAGVKHGVAVSSGTAALHLIVRTLRLTPGAEVLVPSFTFAASVNAFLFEAATPVFVDVERDTYNLDPVDVAAKITDRTGAIMAVDVFGHPAEWEALEEIGQARGIPIIDDCCEAIGARFRDRPVGSFGIAGAFAFYPNKQITTGEGGMVVTNDDEIARLCRSMMNQGRGEMGAWLEHERLGFNYRMDEMSAALGVSQIGRLDTFLRKREHVASMYTERLQGLEWVRPPVVRSHVTMSWFVYVVTLAEDLDRDEIMRRMGEKGIPTRAYFTPIHQQPYIREMFPGQRWQLPVTESVAPRTMALPFHNNLSEGEVDQVVSVLEDAVTGG